MPWMNVKGKNDVKLIIQLLAESKGLPTVKLRAFVTSRPETPIRLGFDSLSEDLYQDLILHQISRKIIEHDITIFLRHEFKSIQRERRLLDNWPGEHHIETLTKKASGLFIYAATVCLFIKNSKFSPLDRLSRFLNDNTVGSVPEPPAKTQGAGCRASGTMDSHLLAVSGVSSCLQRS